MDEKKMMEKIDLLHELVDAADVMDAANRYLLGYKVSINGTVDCSAIREIFGWDLSKAALDIREVRNGKDQSV